MKIKLNYYDLKKQLENYQNLLEEYEDRGNFDDDNSYDAFCIRKNCLQRANCEIAN